MELRNVHHPIRRTIILVLLTLQLPLAQAEILPPIVAYQGATVHPAKKSWCRGPDKQSVVDLVVQGPIPEEEQQRSEFRKKLFLLTEAALQFECPGVKAINIKTPRSDLFATGQTALGRADWEARQKKRDDQKKSNNYKSARTRENEERLAAYNAARMKQLETYLKRFNNIPETVFTEVRRGYQNPVQGADPRDVIDAAGDFIRRTRPSGDSYSYVRGLANITRVGDAKKISEKQQLELEMPAEFYLASGVVEYTVKDQGADWTAGAELWYFSSEGKFLCARLDATHCDYWYGRVAGLHPDTYRFEQSELNRYLKTKKITEEVESLLGEHCTREVEDLGGRRCVETAPNTFTRTVNVVVNSSQKALRFTCWKQKPDLGDTTDHIRVVLGPGEEQRECDRFKPYVPWSDDA